MSDKFYNKNLIKFNEYKIKLNYILNYFYNIYIYI